MKRVVRWIGMGIVAAAAATMLLADVALAQPASDGRGRWAPKHVYVMQFDILSRGDISCAIDAPGSQVRTSHDIMGHPHIRIWGDPAAATIICTDGEGVRWEATAQKTAPYIRAGTIYGTVLYRPDRAATMTIVDVGNRTEYQHKTFVRLD